MQTVAMMIGIVTIITRMSWLCNIFLCYQGYRIVPCANEAQGYKIVIELSGVQVGNHISVIGMISNWNNRAARV